MKEKIINLLNKNNLNLDKIQKFTNLDQEILKNYIQELIEEKQIFLNTSNKYEIIKEDYLIGTLDKISKNDYYIKVNNKKISIAPSDLHTALKNDLVVVEKKYDGCGTIKGILKRTNNKLVCEVKEWNNKLVLVPFNINCEINLITSQKQLKDYIIGDRVYTTLSNESSEENYIVVKNITKIGHFNDQNNDAIAIAISKDFDIEFSSEAIKEAEAIPQTVQSHEKKNRLDLTNENIFTIDSIHTKDMDDAISIKVLANGNYELGIHIADVAHYIKPGTALFNDALKRGQVFI